MAVTEEGPVRADAEDVVVLGDLAGSAAAVRRVLLPTISKARHSNNRSMRCASRSRICSGRFSNCKLHCRRAHFEAGPTDLGDLPDWPERDPTHQGADLRDRNRVRRLLDRMDNSSIHSMACQPAFRWRAVAAGINPRRSSVCRPDTATTARR